MNYDTVTKKQILPYEFSLLKKPNQPTRVQIKNTRGQIIAVTESEILRQLERQDLDPHRRRMYEAALQTLTGRKP
jgi:hypothetical protein